MFHLISLTLTMSHPVALIVLITYFSGLMGALVVTALLWISRPKMSQADLELEPPLRVYLTFSMLWFIPVTVFVRNAIRRRRSVVLG